MNSRRTIRPALAVAVPVTPAGWLLLLAIAAAPLPLLGQYVAGGGDGFTFSPPVVSLTIRGGYDRPLASGDIFAFTTKNLTLNKGDFAAASISADLGLRMNTRAELVLSAGTASTQKPSEFRKFVDNNDLPIEQKTRLSRTPVTLGVRYALRQTGERIGKFAWIPARFTPWVGGGVGAMYYKFEQAGDWVNFQTLAVFTDTFTSTAWAPMAYAHVGADMRLTTHLAFTGDLRYSAARATMGGDSFQGFGKIDLSGAAATFGLTARY